MFSPIKRVWSVFSSPPWCSSSPQSGTIQCAFMIIRWKGFEITDTMVYNCVCGHAVILRLIGREPQCVCSSVHSRTSVFVCVITVTNTHMMPIFIVIMPLLQKYAKLEYMSATPTAQDASSDGQVIFSMQDFRCFCRFGSLNKHPPHYCWNYVGQNELWTRVNDGPGPFKFPFLFPPQISGSSQEICWHYHQYISQTRWNKILCFDSFFPIGWNWTVIEWILLMKIKSLHLVIFW